MARIVIGLYLVRYPLGGMMSNAIEYASGFQALGHDVWIVERASYHQACFDPTRNVMTDDPQAGVAAVAPVLDRFALGDRWMFESVDRVRHGPAADRVDDLFATADVFVDYGTHGAFAEEAMGCGARILIDGEPGYNQIRMEQTEANGETLVEYDAYFTNGRAVGTPASPSPTAARRWQPIFHPVDVDHFATEPRPADDAPYTSIMNWRSHDELEWQGQRLGQKDRQFPRYLNLPAHAPAAFEIAIAGDAPRHELERAGWTMVDAHDATSTYDGFGEHIRRSRGEFSVVKHVFAALRTAWFSDRSAAYLASGRPVVLEETGWSEHLPTGHGLFAVDDLASAAEAITTIESDWQEHALAAREIARAHLHPSVVLPTILDAV